MTFLHKLLKLHFILQFLAGCALANEAAQVLPKGVHHPQVLFGSVTGVEDRYNSNGLLEGATARYHIVVNSAMIVRLSDEYKQQLDQLNTQFPKLQALGNELSLGTLDFKIDPKVTYVAPVYAYGLTERVTLGIGVPVIRVQNRIQIVNGGVNNAGAIFDAVSRTDSNGNQVSLDPSGEAGEKLLKLSQIDLAQKFCETLELRGYRSCARANYDDTSLGDVTVTALWQYYSSRHFDLALRPYLVLPTGRKDDPDDVFDVATGGQTAVGTEAIQDWKVHRDITLGAAAGYKYLVPDHRDARVPRDENDLLPDVDRKESVGRKLGDEISAELNMRWKALRSLFFGGYWEVMQKVSDSYRGDHANYNYSLLGRDSNVTTQTARVVVTFSTVDWYKTKTFAMPFEISFSYADTFDAVNWPNYKISQLAFKAFF